MKKVNLIILSLIFIISEICYQTLKSLKVVNTIDDDDKNKIGVKKYRSKKVANYHYLWTQIKWVYGGRDRTGKIILLPIVNVNQSVRAAMLAPKDKDGRVDLGNSIRVKGAITTWITIPPLQLAALIPLIKAVNDSHTEAEMNSAWFALNKALRKIMQLVQDCMDLNVAEAANIAALYGFSLWGKGGAHEQIFEGFTGTVTGTVDMLAEVGHTGCAYAWFSWNSAKTIKTYIKTSTYAHCTIAGQVSHMPLNVSCDTVLGEDVIHESQIIEVIPK